MTEKIKYVAAYIPAWSFYLAGDIISRIINIKVFEWLFPLYSMLMDWSLFFSDWGNIGVWLDE